MICNNFNKSGFSFQHAFVKKKFNRLVSYFHLTFWGELYCENSEKKVISESNLKVGLCGHLTIRHSCATDAESLGNRTVNQNMWPHLMYHNYEFKCQCISRYPLSMKMNEITIVIKCRAIKFLKCKCARLTEFYRTYSNAT